MSINMLTQYEIDQMKIAALNSVLISIIILLVIVGCE